jgi:hypothetical protein
MNNQTNKNDPINRGRDELDELVRSIWLRGLDSNQRPSGYTYSLLS